MTMPLSLPQITADGPRRTLTLADLRKLVAATEHLPEGVIVRGTAIPFHLPDLGNPLGGRLMAISLDAADDQPDAPVSTEKRP
jgi:hypothetical protein